MVPGHLRCLCSVILDLSSTFRNCPSFDVVDIQFSCIKCSCNFFARNAFNLNLCLQWGYEIVFSSVLNFTETNYNSFVSDPDVAVSQFFTDECSRGRKMSSVTTSLLL